MGCPSCGAENPSTNKFCGECGAVLALVCGGCSTRNPPTNRFCGECGGRLAVGAGTSTPAPPASPPSPESYTPRHLAEKILASRDALAGERKQVTVLFADVVGSTELIQGRDAEEAQALLDGVVKVMMGAVHRYEGTVSRLTGDGLMALFGAPLGHEDHALRACYAALAMQDAVRRHAERVRRETGAMLTIRVGLSAGEVVVRAIRDDLHMDFTAMGQTVHLAARMEQLAKPETIALTPETLALVEGYVRVRSLGALPVKGLPEPIEVFELLGAGQARTRLQAAVARGLTRFVGRDAEMAALYAALERAGGGHGQVAALVGEPGVGKSRLVWELTDAHRTEGWLVLESGSVSYGKATPYLPIIDLLKAYCRIEARDAPRTVREKLAGKLLMLDRALEPDLPALLALLDVPTEDAVWAALDPPRRRRRTLEAVKRLLLRESREQPVLLVFEDLHWIDAETQALLDALVEALPTARILLLVNYRPEYADAWGNKCYYIQLRIDPLGGDGADELLAGLLGGDPSLGPLKALLAKRTGRNPFFLEESVRALAETGALEGRPGGYRLPVPLASLRVPRTVQAVLAARIDRLPPDEKLLLQTAAAIGKDVPDALLRAVAGAPEDELRRGLDALREAEFLYEATLFPEPEYTFKHALTHEVAYGGLLRERRRALHGRVVEAIERLYTERREEQVDRLAHHAMRAESWGAALRYLREAAAKVMARSAHREAAGYLDQALVALGHLPESREVLEQAVDIRLDSRTVLWSSGDLARIVSHLTEAAALADALGDRRRGGYAAHFMCTALYGLARHDEAVAAGRRALAIADDLADRELRTLVEVWLGQAHVGRTDYRRAIELSEAAVAHLGGPLLHERLGQVVLPSVLARVVLARALAELGRFDEGVEYGEEGVRIAEVADHPASLALAVWVGSPGTELEFAL